MAARVEVEAANPNQDQNAPKTTRQNSTTPFNTFIEQIIEAPRRTEEYKEEEVLCWEVIEELARRVREARKAQPPKDQLHKDIMEIKDALKKIEDTQKKPLPTPARPVPVVAGATLAQLVAAGIAQPTHNDRSTPPLRKTREVLVRIQDKEEAQRLQTKSTEQILRSIAEKSATQRDQIASIRRLPSGDIALHATSPEARKELEKKGEWVTGITSSAKIVRRTCAVLAHGVRTTLDTQSMNATIAKLHKDNERVHPGLEILRIAWPKQVVNSGKAFSSLIVEVADETMANRLMDHGLIEGYTSCACEYFEKKSRITQCFNCFAFGHVARGCTKVPVCHRCGQNHKAEDCKQQTEREHCSNCKKDGHKPWIKTCPHWKAAKKSASEIFKSRPQRYAENRGRAEPQQFPSFHFSRTPSSSTASDTIVDEDGFSEIGGKRRRLGVGTSRKGPGRPVGSTNANRAKAANNQQRIPFAPSQ